MRIQLNSILQSHSELNTGISLHSLRRGGSFYRVFESPSKRFNFRELMAWCRWTDEKTCCEYLITRDISNGIDPRNLLRENTVNNGVINVVNSDPNINNNITVQDICNAIFAHLNATNTSITQNVTKNYTNVTINNTRQSTLDNYVAQVSIPTASSAKQAWNQWFMAVPEVGLFSPLKSFDKDMIRRNRKKYSERQTLSLAFEKYDSYESFEAKYAGYISTYSTILKEVRKRKREHCL